MNNLIVGIAASILAIFIFYVFKEFIIPEAGRLLFSSIPPVKGKYKAIVARDEHVAEPQVYIIRQWGSIVWGDIEVKVKDNIEKYKLSGRVFPSRIIRYEFEARSKHINDYGVGLLVLAFDGKTANGHFCTICETCQKPHSLEITLKKFA